MHVSGIFDLYNLANRDLMKANTVLLIRFGLGRSKIVKLLDRIQSIYGRTMCSLVVNAPEQALVLDRPGPRSLQFGRGTFFGLDSVHAQHLLMILSLIHI